MIRRAGTWWLAAAATAVIGCRTPSDGPTYPCCHIDEELTLDGILNESPWAEAPRVELVRTDSGKQPALPTHARMLWSDDYFYVGFWCADHDIAAEMTERDAPLYKENEVVEIFLTPLGDPSSYFELQINPNNAAYDTAVFNPEGVGSGCRLDISWTCAGLRHGVQLAGTLNDPSDRDTAWSCELGIPITTMIAPGKSVQPGDRWRVNLYRVNRTPEGVEYAAWSPTGAIDYHRPRRFGVVKFVR